MSGNILSLKLQPLVRVERWTAGWMVTVRPSPEGIASLRNFDTESAAADYALALKAEHGFRIRPDKYDQRPEAAA